MGKLKGDKAMNRWSERADEETKNLSSRAGRGRGGGVSFSSTQHPGWAAHIYEISSSKSTGFPLLPAGTGLICRTELRLVLCDHGRLHWDRKTWNI